MPLLRKQPFHRQKIPHDLHPEEEVFHCKITNEIFRDYNVFFERIILCNSLVWSCAITGKSGMTFKEAEECEEKAKKNLANFQDSLKRPLLYLATLTHRSRLNDVNDDVFMFAKDRFFIGESLEYSSENQRKSCKVISVIPYQSQEEKPNGDIIVIEDSDEDSNQGVANTKKKKVSSLDPAKFKYKIKILSQVDPVIVPATSLSRKRGLYSRERSKLFLKQHCDPFDGLWKVKESTLKKLGLNKTVFQDFFPGPPPVFQVSPIKRKKNAKRPLETPSSHIEFEEPPSCSPNKVPKSSKPQKEPQIEYVPLPTQEDRALMREKLKQQKIEEREAKREEMRRQIEEEKIRRKEERLKEKLKKTEEKRRELELYKEWAKPRDDLECDDLKEMPQFLPVRTRVPSELFGTAVMILEFTHSFKSIFDFKQFFPKGFTWGMIESALMDHEPDGPLCDLLQMLLCALFNLQEEEAEEYQELEKEESVGKSEDKDDDVEEEISKNEMIKAATIMAQFSQNTLGMPLRDTLLDQFTLSEILRIHILSSGARASNKNARFRYQQRGGYTEHDDPGLHMKIEHGDIVRSLAEVNVFDLPPGDKVKIIDVLIQQILTYAMVRDMIEESADKLRLKKYDLKQLQWAEQRREKEEQANRYKKMMEERAKEQAKRMQQLLAEQNGMGQDAAPAPLTDVSEKSAEEKEIDKQKEHEMETRKKAEFSKKETEMVQEILSLQKMVSLYPIGRDRLFRRYFFFPTLNGVFIEDHELHVPPDMLKPGLATADTGQKLKLLPQLTFHGNEKANGLVKSNGDDCIVISDDENNVKNVAKEDVKEKEDKDEKEAIQKAENTLNSCPDEDGSKVKVEVSGEVEASPGEESPPVLENEIHNESPKYDQNPMWSFIDTPEYLNALVACLNSRGFRECSLKTALLEMKPFLAKSIQECPTDILSLPEDGGEEKVRIQALALTRGISSKKAAQDALMCVQEKAEATMEINLRDALLDMEDRIHVGGLGSLKIPNRTSWRDALLNRSYESQSSDANLQPSGKAHVNGDQHGSVDKSHYVAVAQDLGRALVQIARGVELRFMREPLRDEEKKKKNSKEKKKKEGDDSDGETPTSKKTVTIYERWEESLLGCTSLSQVYLHLASLDKSIVWTKSTLETRCRLCRRKGDAEKMLLCDGCDRGHHMYCLKPPMEKVPKGEWFCPDCRPKQVPRSPVRKGRRKTFTEEEEPEAEEEEMEMSADQSLEEEEAQEDTTMEEEVEDEEEEEEVEEEEDENDEDVSEAEDSDEEQGLETNDYGEEVCSGCKTSGTLICCDCCPRAFHMHCAKPALKKVPKGKWMCQVCMGIDGSGKIKISGAKAGKSGKQKGKMSEVPSYTKGKEKRSPGSLPSSRPNSRPNSRQGSPRDSPVLGRSRKHQTSSLALEEQPKLKRSKSTPKISGKNSNDSDSPIIRLMKPINPSSKRSNSHQQQLKAAEDLVNELMKQEEAWPFLKPVDKKLVPDYYDVIKKPMDFGTIRNKIHAFSYSKPSEILADVRRIFSNCIEYNNRSSPEYKAYFQLSKFFEKRMKEKGLEEDASNSKSNQGRVSL